MNVQVIDDIIQILKDDQVFEGLFTLYSNADNELKIEIIDIISDRCTMHANWNPPKIPLNESKNNEKSKAFRNDGNKHFANHTRDHYLKAIECYNKAVCFAENDSEEISLAFGNRSAVYLKLHLYDVCLENIQIAKNAGYPKRLMHKLDEREKFCAEQKAHSIGSVAAIQPKLTVPPNPRIPFVANCLKLCKNDQYGRHIITNKDLKPGDVVAIEEDAFSAVLPKVFRYTRCGNCLKENYQNLISCKSCSAIMFCSQKCQQDAFVRFHKFECPVMNYMDKMLDTELCSLRTVLCAITSFASVGELVAFTEEAKDSDTTVFDVNYDEETTHNGSTMYGPVHCLSEHKDSILIKFGRSLLGSIIYNCLLQYTSIKELFTTPKEIFVLKELVIHHINTVAINRCILNIYNVNTRLMDEFATCVYPLRSMFSHSCAPNLLCTSAGKKMVFTILKPIKAGEQLFDNYGARHCDVSLSQRRGHLNTFTCKCIACENNYPLFQNSPIVNIPHFLLPPNILSHTEIMKTFGKYLAKYARFYPCQQLISAENDLFYYLESSPRGFLQEIPMISIIKQVI